MKKTISALACCYLFAVLGCASAGTNSVDADYETLQVYLVRHAEKIDDGRDPALSEAGVQRANSLSAMLRNAGIEYVHSSDYRRTRDTAKPVADTLGLELLLYDPRDLPAMAATLRMLGGRHLVVGHSNTTPQLAALLGGDPGPPIEEASEYDRLYFVSADPDGTVRSTMMRYGQPSR